MFSAVSHCMSCGNTVLDKYYHFWKISALGYYQGVFVLNMTFGLTELRTGTLVFLFIACIRFSASDLLIGVLRKDMFVTCLRKIEQWIK